MYSHFLQSSAWKTFNESEGKTCFSVEKPNFSFLAVLEQTKLGNYLFLPYGPSLSKSDPLPALSEALSELKTLGKAHHCFFVRLEPTFPFSPADLSSLGLKKSKDIDPADTWLLDLRPPRETLLKNFAQGTRTRFNQFSKKGLSIETTTDPEKISSLVSLQHKLAAERGIHAYPAAHLKAELAQPFSTLYLVHYSPDTAASPETSDSLAPSSSEKTIIAASLFFDDPVGKTRFYMQSAADSDYKKLPATAGLLATAIFDAKEKGLETFDFWGIAPDSAPPDHPWAGFTKFKQSFGGFARSYSGTYDLLLDQKKYTLYSSLRRINLRLRKKK